MPSTPQPAPHLTRRDVLALGLASAFLHHARAADVMRFPLGVASGYPRPDGMVLWTRLMGPDLAERVKVQWEVASDERFKRVVARGHEVAERAWAHSVHAEPQGLQPGRPYWYRFTALGQRSEVGRTRTTPAPDAPPGRLRFAIASCQRYDHSHYAAWRHLASQDLDLVLFLGDYLYEYPSSPLALRQHTPGFTLTLDDYRARYAQYKGDPSLQAAHAMAPWLAVWDDHEIENNYAAGVPEHGPSPAFAHRRAVATQAYWEHLPFPNAMRPRGSVMPLYQRCDWGSLARIHTLDGRQYRDVQACPGFGRHGANSVPLKNCAALIDSRRSLLGATQEQWLAEGWDRIRPWNLLAQQTLMARFSWSDPTKGAGTYWTDGWDGYAATRQRLLAGVAERQLPGVVVLGGDVHAHYVADLKLDDDDARSPVVASEFCGTSIASHGMAQSRLDRALPFNPHVHYARSDKRGYVSFTLSARQLEASLMGVTDPRDPASAVEVLRRFAVEAGRPGVQPV